jgi:hypothetical protein
MNIFERAARAKLRFVCPAGNFTVENLFDLRLTDGAARPSLDNLARGIARELRNEDEESFVQPEKRNKRREELELKLDVLKHVIADRIAARDASATAAANADRRQKLVNALAAKEESTLVGMTKEEIEAEIAKLSGIPSVGGEATLAA